MPRLSTSTQGINVNNLLFLFPDSSIGKEYTCNAGDASSIPGFIKIPGGRDRLPTPVFLGFSCGSAGKESTCNVVDLGLIPGLGRSPGEGIGYPLQYSGLENSMDYTVLYSLYSPWGRKELDTTERLSQFCFSASHSQTLFIREGGTIFKIVWWLDQSEQLLQAKTERNLMNVNVK